MKILSLVVVACATALMAGCTALTTQPITDVSYRVPLTKKLTLDEEMYCWDRAVAAGNKARNNTVAREGLGTLAGLAGGALLGHGLGNSYGYHGYGPYGSWYNPYGFARGGAGLAAAGAGVGALAGAGLGGATGPGDPDAITQRVYLECTDRASR